MVYEAMKFNIVTISIVVIRLTNINPYLTTQY